MTQTVANKKRLGRNNTQRIVRVLHIYTSMFMLLIMLFFTLTGLTLNHRDWLPEAPAADVQELSLPSSLLHLERWSELPLQQAELVRRWLFDTQAVYGNQVSYDWQADEQVLVIDVKRPGGYSLVEVMPEEGVALLEQQSYGVVAVLNDLHMGRYSGLLWSVFIDLSALVMLLFTLTGFWLVLPQKKRRQRLVSLAGVGLALMFIAYRIVLLP